MKSTLYVVGGHLGTKALSLTGLERTGLMKALGVVLRKGGDASDCRIYRKLLLRMEHSLGLRYRRSV